MNTLSEAQAQRESAERSLKRAQAEEDCEYLRNCGWVIVRSGHDPQFFLAESPYTKQLFDIPDALRIEKLKRRI